MKVRTSPRRPLAVILSATALLLAVIAAVRFSVESLSIDRCLDLGGCVNAIDQRCETFDQSACQQNP